MRVYVETNFVQELTLLQGETAACENLLEICEGGKADLVIPAFGIVEPVWKIGRNKQNREGFRSELQKDLKQLSRSADYTSPIKQIKELDRILTLAINDEQKRYAEVRERVCSIATIIPLDHNILARCRQEQESLDFQKFTDTVVFTSIISHLENATSEISCFLNKDAKDFLVPAVQKRFKDLDCEILLSFGEGLGRVLAGPQQKL